MASPYGSYVPTPVTTSSVKPSEPAPVPSAEKIKRHPKYYLSGGDTFFLVEGWIYRVHRYFFERESAVFREMLCAPPPPGQPQRGSSDTTAISLTGVKEVDFSRFLWVFYNPKYSIYDANVDEWSSILKLAFDWRFGEIKRLATRYIEGYAMDPVDKIELYQWYDVDKRLLIPSYIALVNRREPLSIHEGRRLTLETALLIATARECARGKPLDSGRHSPTTATVGAEHMVGIISDVFGLANVSSDSPSLEPISEGTGPSAFTASAVVSPMKIVTTAPTVPEKEEPVSPTLSRRPQPETPKVPDTPNTAAKGYLNQASALTGIFSSPFTSKEPNDVFSATTPASASANGAAASKTGQSVAGKGKGKETPETTRKTAKPQSTPKPPSSPKTSRPAVPPPTTTKTSKAARAEAGAMASGGNTPKRASPIGNVADDRTDTAHGASKGQNDTRSAVLSSPPALTNTPKAESPSVVQRKAETLPAQSLKAKKGSQKQFSAQSSAQLSEPAGTPRAAASPAIPKARDALTTPTTHETPKTEDTPNPPNPQPAEVPLLTPASASVPEIDDAARTGTDANATAPQIEGSHDVSDDQASAAIATIPATNDSWDFGNEEWHDAASSGISEDWKSLTSDATIEGASSPPAGETTLVDLADQPFEDSVHVSPPSSPSVPSSTPGVEGPSSFIVVSHADAENPTTPETENVQTGQSTPSTERASGQADDRTAVASPVVEEPTEKGQEQATTEAKAVSEPVISQPPVATLDGASAELASLAPAHEQSTDNEPALTVASTVPADPTTITIEQPADPTEAGAQASTDLGTPSESSGNQTQETVKLDAPDAAVENGATVVFEPAASETTNGDNTSTGKTDAPGTSIESGATVVFEPAPETTNGDSTPMVKPEVPDTSVESGATVVFEPAAPETTDSNTDPTVKTDTPVTSVESGAPAPANDDNGQSVAPGSGDDAATKPAGDPSPTPADVSTNPPEVTTSAPTEASSPLAPSPEPSKAAVDAPSNSAEQAESSKPADKKSAIKPALHVETTPAKDSSVETTTTKPVVATATPAELTANPDDQDGDPTDAAEGEQDDAMNPGASKSRRKKNKRNKNKSQATPVAPEQTGTADKQVKKVIDAAAAIVSQQASQTAAAAPEPAKSESQDSRSQETKPIAEAPATTQDDVQPSEAKQEEIQQQETKPNEIEPQGTTQEGAGTQQSETPIPAGPNANASGSEGTAATPSADAPPTTAPAPPSAAALPAEQEQKTDSISPSLPVSGTPKDLPPPTDTEKDAAAPSSTEAKEAGTEATTAPDAKDEIAPPRKDNFLLELAQKPNLRIQVTTAPSEADESEPEESGSATVTTAVSAGASLRDRMRLLKEKATGKSHGGSNSVPPSENESSASTSPNTSTLSKGQRKKLKAKAKAANSK